MHAGASAVRYFMTLGDPTVVSQWFFFIRNTKLIFKVWLFDPCLTSRDDTYFWLTYYDFNMQESQLIAISKQIDNTPYVIAMTGQEINNKWHKYVASPRDHLLSHIICDPCDYI